MRVRQRVAVREHCPATDAAAEATPRKSRFSCRARTIARSGRPKNVPPVERYPLVYAAEAAARPEIRPAGNKDPGEIIFRERNGEGSHSLRKSRAHPRGKYRNFPDAGLRHPAGIAAILPACSTATRRPRRETMCRRAPREFAPGAIAPPR